MRSSSLICNCYVINVFATYSPTLKAEPQAGVTMANQDWETKLENEMRMVRRLLWEAGDRWNVRHF